MTFSVLDMVWTPALIATDGNECMSDLSAVPAFNSPPAFLSNWLFR